MSAMSAKAALSLQEVNERRLKGIYDQLDSCNFKKAISEADKVLKKNPSLSPAKVLKALALLRLGKNHEAYMIADEIARTIPSDEATLNSLSYFFKESNQKDRIVEIYEQAYKKYPDREDICSYLFYCHVKSQNFAAQQKVAQQLKKLKGDNMEYPLWPIVSNVLQGAYSSDSRFLKLGEAMLTKMFSSDAILSAERIQFLLFVFEKQEKYAEAFKWLTSDTLRDVVENQQNLMLFNNIKIDLLKKLGRLEETLEFYWTFLENNLEDVLMWKDYIDTAVRLDLQNCHSVAAVIEKVSHLEKDKSSSKLLNIHLCLALSRATGQPHLQQLGDSKVAGLVDYAVHFGDKPSCVYDIYNFLRLEDFSNQERHQVYKDIQSSDRFSGLSASTLSDTKDLERVYLREVVCRAVTGSSNGELLTIYEAGLQLSDNVSSTEIRPADNLLRFIVSMDYQKLVEETATGNWPQKQLLSLAQLLQSGMARSPCNHFLLVQYTQLLGSRLGCGPAMLRQLQSLEVKQLLWDSMGHLFVLPLLHSPCLEVRTKLMRLNHRRRLKNKLELEEGWVTCYKLGNYGRIPEMIEFYHDIENSLMSELCEMESTFCDIFFKTHSLDDLFSACGDINCSHIESQDAELDMSAVYSQLRDHRDLDIVPDFPVFANHWTEEDKTNSFNHLVSWIVHRALLVRLAYSGAKVVMETVVKLSRESLATSDGTESGGPYVGVLKSVRRQLECLQAQPMPVYPRLSENALPGCMYLPAINIRARLAVLLADSILAFHARFVLGHLDSKLPDLDIALATTLMGPAITKVRETASFVPALLAAVTDVCEMFSMALLLFLMLDNVSQPLKPRKKTVTKKGKKKRNQGDELPELVRESFTTEKLSHFLVQTHFCDTLAHLMTDCDSVLEIVRLATASLDDDNDMDIVIKGDWLTGLNCATGILVQKKTVLNHLHNSCTPDNESGLEQPLATVSLNNNH